MLSFKMIVCEKAVDLVIFFFVSCQMFKSTHSQTNMLCMSLSVHVFLQTLPEGKKKKKKKVFSYLCGVHHPFPINTG